MASGNVLAILLWSSAALGRLLFMLRLLLKMIPFHHRKTRMAGIWDVSTRSRHFIRARFASRFHYRLQEYAIFIGGVGISTYLCHFLNLLQENCIFSTTLTIMQCIVYTIQRKREGERNRGRSSLFAIQLHYNFLSPQHLRFHSLCDFSTVFFLIFFSKLSSHSKLTVRTSYFPY